MIRSVLIVALAPVWLTAFALGVIAGFTWEFAMAGWYTGPVVAARIDEGAAWTEVGR